MTDQGAKGCVHLPQPPLSVNHAETNGGLVKQAIAGRPRLLAIADVHREGRHHPRPLRNVGTHPIVARHPVKLVILTAKAKLYRKGFCRQNAIANIVFKAGNVIRVNAGHPETWFCPKFSNGIPIKVLTTGGNV
jgi:hypothetical protein